jgi:two-component system, response regulator
MANALKILLVEDDFEHLQLTKYILQRNKVPGEVYVVRDGQEAIDFLFKRNGYANPTGPVPSLVLLDLNIPRVDGKEVLRIMKQDSRLKDIPVVIVSSSNREEDVAFARQAGASDYISKSGGFEKLTEALSAAHLLSLHK